MDAVTTIPEPVNEPVRQYAPGSAERAELEGTLKRMQSDTYELTMTIGGERRMAAGEPIDVVQPHNRHHVLGTHGQRDRRRRAGGGRRRQGGRARLAGDVLRRPRRDLAQGRRPARRAVALRP